MILFEHVDAIEPPAGGEPVHVAVGTFDGVHRGHQALLRRLEREASESGGQAMVLTFQNHPRSVVDPENTPGLLTPWPLKRRLLLTQPVDRVAGIPFDAEFSKITAAEFIRDVLVRRCGAVAIHSGPHFHFGHGGKGSPKLLRELAPSLGYRYEQLEPVSVGPERISSTRIRETLRGGGVREAGELLGRPYQFSGEVVPGDALGRTLGFPTANLRVSREVLLPADGGYAVQVSGERLAGPVPGMMNIGYRPTVGGKEHRIEVHLIGWEGELRGASLTVQFAERLRGEKRFGGKEELVGQLQQDREHALRVLGDQELPAPA